MLRSKSKWFGKAQSPKAFKLEETNLLEVAKYQESILSIKASIRRTTSNRINPFGEYESQLNLTLRNEGEFDIENLVIIAFAPDGIELVDPGLLFGSSRRHVRLPELKAKKEITYKVAIRNSPMFRSGSLEIEIKNGGWKLEEPGIKIRLGVIAN